MKALEFQELRRDLNYTLADLADILNISERQVRNYENEMTPIDRVTRLAMETLATRSMNRSLPNIKVGTKLRFINSTKADYEVISEDEPGFWTLRSTISECERYLCRKTEDILEDLRPLDTVRLHLYTGPITEADLKCVKDYVPEPFKGCITEEFIRAIITSRNVDNLIGQSFTQHGISSDSNNRDDLFCWIDECGWWK